MHIDCICGMHSAAPIHTHIIITTIIITIDSKSGHQDNDIVIMMTMIMTIIMVTMTIIMVMMMVIEKG